MLILHQLLHLLSNIYAIKVKRVKLGHISLLTVKTCRSNGLKVNKTRYPIRTQL
ncbi:hypothetical protein Hanom_Chr12g01066281 [Helianthus anomalus]